MSKNKKSLQDLTLLDRFLFAEVMEDPKTFENILSIILGEDISIKGRPQSEHENRTSPLKRQVLQDRQLMRSFLCFPFHVHQIR